MNRLSSSNPISTSPVATSENLVPAGERPDVRFVPRDHQFGEQIPHGLVRAVRRSVIDNMDLLVRISLLPAGGERLQQLFPRLRVAIM